MYPPSGIPYAMLYPKKKKTMEQIANLPIFFAPIVDTLFVVTSPLSSIQKPAAIKATKTPPI